MSKARWSIPRLGFVEVHQAPCVHHLKLVYLCCFNPNSEFIEHPIILGDRYIGAHLSDLKDSIGERGRSFAQEAITESHAIYYKNHNSFAKSLRLQHIARHPSQGLDHPSRTIMSFALWNLIEALLLLLLKGRNHCKWWIRSIFELNRDIADTASEHDISCDVRTRVLSGVAHGRHGDNKDVVNR